MYRCRNGLTDCAAPIVLDGQHVANLFIGQFFLDAPDLAYFEQQQQAFGFDKTAYFEALDEVPIVTGAKLPAITKLMTGFANQIVSLSLARKAALNAQKTIEKQVEARTRELEVVVQKLKISEQKLAMLYQEAPVGLALNRLDDGGFIEGNPAMYQITGHTPEDFEQLSHWDITPPEYTQAESEQLNTLQQTGRYGPYEKEYFHKDGHRVNVLLHGVRLDLPNEQLIFSVVQDITERKQADEQIRHLAYYDALTQLPNRRLFNDRLQQAMVTSHRTGRYCALMFLDLDNFKPLNDHYGHDVGDLLLQEVSRRLIECTRKMDTVARFGGDEFIVMIRELNMDRHISTHHAAIVAEKIRSVLASPYILKLPNARENETQVEHHCTASIGVVMFTDHLGHYDDVLKWADLAMYQAKEKGGNIFHFYEPMSLLSNNP
jgi:diguanylate cyclase (GGDEF)-like protein/PAS domain S-box-containing protein